MRSVTARETGDAVSDGSEATQIQAYTLAMSACEPAFRYERDIVSKLPVSRREICLIVMSNSRPSLHSPPTPILWAVISGGKPISGRESRRFCRGSFSIPRKVFGLYPSS